MQESGSLITVTTIIGGVMLLGSIASLVFGMVRARRARRAGKSQLNAGVFILVGFALLAMGSLAFFLGTFRPGP